MLVGHVAVGLAGKRVVPGISLGTLVLAAVAADLLWCLFLMVGLERVEIRAAGPTLMKSVVISEVPYSHSLLMDGLWASVFALAYFRVRRSARGAGVVAGHGRKRGRAVTASGSEWWFSPLPGGAMLPGRRLATWSRPESRA